MWLGELHLDELGRKGGGIAVMWIRGTSGRGRRANACL